MSKFLNIEVTESGIWMDGGTMTINANLQNGESVEIELVQNMIIEKTVEGKYAGQLYLDNAHVEPRSELEKQIIEGLKEVLSKKGGMPYMDKSILREKLEYVESKQYLIDLKQMQTSGV